MRLCAPLQSWGASSRFTRRETEMMPTKSGVIGMIAAALGMKRSEGLLRFEGLRFGVRVDQPGTLMSDYQVAQKFPEKPRSQRITLPLSKRYYLQDAVFLVGVESEDRQELESYREALSHPYYQLFLGRRSCPPDGPIKTDIQDGDLEDVLKTAPWSATSRYRRYVERTQRHFPERAEGEIVVEPRNEESSGEFIDELNDDPVSFDPRERKWKSRSIKRLPDAVRFLPSTDGAKPPNSPNGTSELFDDVDIFGAVADAAKGEKE
ncbi:MAG: type I-E CRISPR-associated protein Cas5/CasD [Bifidobacteriaceae bacterium]|nr:type I-E CRISPR-associated protein Cas5/CasD [Bifidobacteriaceae bacterium]MCI1979628.1 type I-E CRISPR-associated protein Cas5/CasD [Bifidobacteriaceae bacterium]